MPQPRPQPRPLFPMYPPVAPGSSVPPVPEMKKVQYVPPALHSEEPKAPYAPPIPSSGERKALFEKIKKKSLFRRFHHPFIVKEVEDEHFAESSKTLAEVDEIEKVIDINAQELQTKRAQFAKKTEEILKSNENLKTMNAVMLNLADNAAKCDLKEENIFEFVKPANIYHEKWIEKECKKLAIEECVMQLKKAYEDKIITLDTLLKHTRKLYSKQFKCIYTKGVIERKYRKSLAD